jgi:hypothetical protein
MIDLVVSGAAPSERYRRDRLAAPGWAAGVQQTGALNAVDPEPLQIFTLTRRRWAVILAGSRVIAASCVKPSSGVLSRSPERQMGWATGPPRTRSRDAGGVVSEEASASVSMLAG